MQERVYNKGKIANVEELRQRIVDKWVRLDQRIIDGAVKEWRKRLRACAAAEGGQFEHELWLLMQSHAAAVKYYNAFCVKLTTNSDIEQWRLYRGGQGGRCPPK